MNFQDVALLPSRASFPPHFLNNCGRCEGLRTTTCLSTVVGVSKCMLPVEYYRSTKPLFRVDLILWDHTTACKDEVKSGNPQFWGY